MELARQKKYGPEPADAMQDRVLTFLTPNSYNLSPEIEEVTTDEVARIKQRARTSMEERQHKSALLQEVKLNPWPRGHELRRRTLPM